MASRDGGTYGGFEERRKSYIPEMSVSFYSVDDADFVAQVAFWFLFCSCFLRAEDDVSEFTRFRGALKRTCTGALIDSY